MEELRCHCAMCFKSECKETFCSSICHAHRSTRISKGARREIAVDSDNRVYLKRTTALLLCRYYFIILLGIFNTYKVYL